MQLLKKNTYFINFIVFVLIASTTTLGYQMHIGGNPLSAFWPAAGFSIGLYMVYEKKVFPGIVFGLIIGHLFSRYLLIDEELWISTFYGSITIFADVIFILLFRAILIQSKVKDAITIRTVFIILVAVFISVFIYAAITASVYTLIFPETSFIDTLIMRGNGHILSALIFGMIILFSGYYDAEDKNINHSEIATVLFLSVFSAISFFMFYGENDGFIFSEFKYIYLALFFIPVFIFSYRMILTISMLYVVFAHTFFLSNVPVNELTYENIQVNAFLAILVLISVATRAILLETKRKNKELESSNDQLEHMIDSTFTLLRLGEQQQFQMEFNNSEYIEDLFHVATTIFSNYDRATCYIRGEEFVKFIDVIGYDLDFLNNLPFRIEDFEWEHETPQHYANAGKMIQDSLKDSYSIYIEREPDLKETIQFNIFLDENIVGGISFDILSTSSKTFKKQDYDNLKSFQRIMNGFYQTRFLIARNNSLRDEIVLSLIRTLELYDQYTGGHSEEVATLSQLIANRMGLSEQEQYDIFWAGIVHDIGKVGIPSEILNKPDRLSLEEYEKIKAHPGFGYEILMKSQDLHHIANLVRHHHEWWNGAGYPSGLKENDIPLGSRVIGVTDAVSSMATKRPYTEIKTSEEILKELRLYKGSQFAPDVCDEMIKFIEEGLLDKFYLENKTH